MAEDRTSSFRRNLELEALLTQLNGDLAGAEALAQAPWLDRQPAAPIVLVMGPLRSGTTLFMQWLANTGLAAYPTNLLSRFWRAPIVGARIQQLLTDPRYSFRDELGEFQRQAAYASENGKTRGVLAPNEFWYFWRRFLAEPTRDVWTDAELAATMDTRTMLAELAGLVGVFGKPFAAKGMLFNYNIPFLDRVLEKAVFVHVERDTLANAASVLDARERQLGSSAAWYSFDIPERAALERRGPAEQAVGQVLAINRAVASGLAQVAPERKLNVRYEEFCADPARTYSRLVERLSAQAKVAAPTYAGPPSFPSTNVTASQHDRRSDLETALRTFDLEA